VIAIGERRLFSDGVEIEAVGLVLEKRLSLLGIARIVDVELDFEVLVDVHLSDLFAGEKIVVREKRIGGGRGFGLGGGHGEFGTAVLAPDPLAREFFAQRIGCTATALHTQGHGTGPSGQRRRRNT